MLSQAAIIPFPVRRIRVSRPQLPARLANQRYRSREYLTPDEVAHLIEAARKAGRNGRRDAMMISLAYRHGLRVSELVSLRWEQLDLGAGLLHVRRIKRGNHSVHPLHSSDVKELELLLNERHGRQEVFISERGAKLSADALRKIVSRAGREARIPFPVHPHMLRHACGYKLAQDGQDTRAIQDYLGHKNIQHTVRYTQLSSDRFRGFWSD
ncbi:MAG TPA: tyrosine-type recombinase/integrase [Candidatus Paceibacterota bacterium]